MSWKQSAVKSICGNATYIVAIFSVTSLALYEYKNYIYKASFNDLNRIVSRCSGFVDDHDDASWIISVYFENQHYVDAACIEDLANWVNNGRLNQMRLAILIDTPFDATAFSRHDWINAIEYLRLGPRCVVQQNEIELLFQTAGIGRVVDARLVQE